jgi:hypothetical protein
VLLVGQPVETEVVTPGIQQRLSEDDVNASQLQSHLASCVSFARDRESRIRHMQVAECFSTVVFCWRQRLPWFRFCSEKSTSCLSALMTATPR